jgi:Pheromone A receptor
MVAKMLKLRSLSKICILTLLKILLTVHKRDGQHRGYSPSCQPTPPMQSLDPTYPLYSVLSFLGFVVVLIPFSWHLQAWNAGTCAYMFWVSFACLIEFVNSLVWAGNLFNTIPVWCDISNYFSFIHYIIVRVLTFLLFFSNKVFARSRRWHCRFWVMYQSSPV